MRPAMIWSIVADMLGPGALRSGLTPLSHVAGLYLHGGDAGLVLEIGERSHGVLVLLERLENWAEFEIRAGTARGPAIHRLPMLLVPHDRAVGNIEEARPQLRRGGGLGERGGGRDHCIEQRQSDGDARAPEQRPARKMLSGQIHGLQSSSACMRNASLDTIPATSDENR